SPCRTASPRPRPASHPPARKNPESIRGAPSGKRTRPRCRREIAACLAADSECATGYMARSVGNTRRNPASGCVIRERGSCRGWRCESPGPQRLRSLFVETTFLNGFVGPQADERGVPKHALAAELQIPHFA